MPLKKLSDVSNDVNGMSKIKPSNDEENTSCVNRDKDGFDPALSADEEDTFLRSSETSGTPGTSYDIITKPPPCVKSGLVYDARHNLLSYGNTVKGFPNCKRKRSQDDEGQGRYEVEGHHTSPGCSHWESELEGVNERTCLKKQRFHKHYVGKYLRVDVPRGVKRKNGGLHTNRPQKRMKTYHVVKSLLLRACLLRQYEAEEFQQSPNKRLNASTRDEDAPTCSILISENSFVTLPEDEIILPNDTSKCLETSVEKELSKQVELTCYSEDVHIALPIQNGHAEEISVVARLDADLGTSVEGLSKNVGLSCYSKDFHKTLPSHDVRTEETNAVARLDAELGTSAEELPKQEGLSCCSEDIHITIPSQDGHTEQTGAVANSNVELSTSPNQKVLTCCCEYVRITPPSQDVHTEETCAVARLDADVGTSADIKVGFLKITSSSNDLAAKKRQIFEPISDQLRESSVIKLDSDESSSYSSECNPSSTSESSPSSASESSPSSTLESSQSSTSESNFSATSESNLIATLESSVSPSAEYDSKSSSSETNRSSELSSAEDLSDSDDDSNDDEYPSTSRDESRDELPGMCPRACVCRSGARHPPPPIKRRKGFHVHEPLHKRLLKARLLKQRPLLLNSCCPALCCLEWTRERVRLDDF